MYIWRRSADPRWWSAYESRVRALAGDRVAVIERANRKRLQIEVADKSRDTLRELVSAFGGRIHKLPADWLPRFQRAQKRKPLVIGKTRLIIPAGAAFGTGEHATTAMCLRLLAQTARELRAGWQMIDLGTGSGILALAASRLGANRITAVDNDPIAISTARQNAVRNKITNVSFRTGDARRQRFPRRADVVVANLFSELLIEILPRIRDPRWLILSGILREQKAEVLSALRRRKFEVVAIKHRGKWVAILGKSREKQFAQGGRGG